MLFFVAFALIAGGLEADIGWIYIVLGPLVLAVSATLFMKKPWEHNEE